MTKPTRYDSCYAELIATLKRNPGKTSFPMRRELLEGLAHEMAGVAYALKLERDLVALCAQGDISRAGANYLREHVKPGESAMDAVQRLGLAQCSSASPVPPGVPGRAAPTLRNTRGGNAD